MTQFQEKSNMFYRYPATGVAVTVLLTLLGVKILASFTGLIGQDPYAYLDFTQRLDAYYAGGPHPGGFHWPTFYPWLGSILTQITGNTALSLQLISIVALSVSAGLMVQILRPRKSMGQESAANALHISLPIAIASGFLVAFAPFFFRAGLLVMSESLCIAFLLGMWHSLQRWQQTEKASWLIGAGICATTALMTRYAVGPILLAPAIWAGLTAIRKKQWLSLLVALAVAALPLLPQLLLKTTDPGGFSEHPLWEQWSPMNLFRNEFVTTEGNLHYSFPNLIHVFYHAIHPGFFPLGIFLLPFIRLTDLRPLHQRLLLAMILLYAIFLGGLGYQNDRLLLPTFPLIVIFLAPAMQRGASWIIAKGKNLGKWAVLVLLGLALLALNYRAMAPMISRDRLETTISEHLESQSPHRIYGFALDIAIKGRGSKHDWTNLYLEELSHAEKGEWILFNLDKIAPQWTGHTPMNNWEWLDAQFELTEIQAYPQGWKLYELR